MNGTRDNPVAPDVPFGLVSLITGLIALFVTVFGCLFGVQWLGLPVGVLGVGFAMMGRMQLVQGKSESIDLIIWGIVLNTVSVALNVLSFAFCVAFVGTYFGGILLAVLAL